MTQKDQNARMEIVRNNMKIAVALSDLSATEIARRAEITPNVLLRFMNGKTVLNYSNLVAVCEALNIPVGAISSEQQITPAKIRLYKLLNRMSEAEIQTALEAIAGNDD